MTNKLGLWFSEANIDGSVKKLDYRTRAALVEKVKNLAQLDEERYLIDIVTIISKTSDNFHYSKNSKALFFVVDQMSNKTLCMLYRYVKAVYKANEKAFEKGNSSSFYRLFNDISTQLETENKPQQRVR